MAAHIQLPAYQCSNYFADSVNRFLVKTEEYYPFLYFAISVAENVNDLKMIWDSTVMSQRCTMQNILKLERLKSHNFCILSCKIEFWTTAIVISIQFCSQDEIIVASRTNKKAVGLLAIVYI